MSNWNPPEDDDTPGFGQTAFRDVLFTSPSGEECAIVVVEQDGEPVAIYIEIGNKIIAEREDGAWTPLDPAYTVTDIGDRDGVTVEYHGVRIH